MAFVETPKFPGAVAGVDHLNNWQGLTAAGAGELVAGINNVVTTFSVKAGHGDRYPPDNFTILIGTERMFVSSRSVDTFNTVTRGIDGTTPAAHLIDDPVEHFIDSRFLNRVAVEINALQKSMQGVALVQPIGGIVKPVDGDFAWINQGGASVTVGSDGRIFLKAPGGAGNNLRIRKKAAPGTPWKLTAGFITAMIQADVRCGLVLRESGTGKLINFVEGLLTTDRTRAMLNADWNSPTSFGATNQIAQEWNGHGGPMTWFQIEDNGTNLFFRYSADGENFLEFFSEGRTVFLAGGPDEIGFMASLSTVTYDAGITLVSWKEE